MKNNSVKNAVFWFGGFEVFRFFVNFALNMILAYFFSKEDFGVLAILFVISEIIFSVINMGMGEAIIQSPKINKYYLNSAFWGNLLVAFAMTILMYMLAPLLSSLLQSDELNGLIKLFSIVFIIRGIGVIPLAWCEKHLKFDIISKLSFIAIIVKVIIVIILVIYKYRVYSIVYGEIAFHSIVSLGVYFYVKFIPRIIFFRKKNFLELFSFGNKLLLSNFLSVLSRRADVIIIGKFVSLKELGIYSFAYMMSVTILGVINGIVQKIFFPKFSQIQDNVKELKKNFFETTEVLTTIALPFSTGIYFSCEYFVNYFYKNKWEDSIIIIKILVLYSATNALGGVLWGQLLKALGKSKLVLSLNFIRIIALIVTIAIFSYFYGIIGVACGLFLYSLFFRFYYQNIINKFINSNMKDYLSSIKRPILLNIIMAILLFVLTSVLEQFNISELYKFIFTVSVGVLAYVCALNSLFPYLFKKLINLSKFNT